jgi:nucleotide-binding universal stress UspA family protein
MESLLICYDGSEGSRTALEAAARLFADRSATVACYWEPFPNGQPAKRFAVDIRELVQDADEINQREEQLAASIAEEGAELARAAGLEALAQAVKIDVPIEEAILAHADELDAGAIVMGARSRSHLRSILIGNVATEVVQRSDRPVFLVPSAELADRRRSIAKRRE